MNTLESHEKSVFGMFSRVTRSKFQIAMTAFSPRNFTVKLNVIAPETVLREITVLNTQIMSLQMMK